MLAFCSAYRGGRIKKPKKLLIAGGGSGGHVLPGLVLAQKWMELLPDGEVVFVGAKGKIEEKLVPQAGFRLSLLRVSSLNRVGVGQSVRTLLKIPFSLISSLWILFQERPDVVIGVGGYVSGPPVLMAALLSPFTKWKTAILEQNSVPGKANRWLGSYVGWVFLALEQAGSFFPNSKIQVTGNPIRSNLKALPPSDQKPFRIFVFGGSQGARGLNDLVIGSLDHVQSEVQWVHQTGKQDHGRVKQAHLQLQTGAQVEEFIEDMESEYRRASLVICRAGYTTLSELAAVRRGAILIPLPTASDHHQEKNADVFVKKGAAIQLSQTQTSGRELAKTIDELVQSPEKIHEMEQKIGQFHRPHAAQDILKTVLSSS